MEVASHGRRSVAGQFQDTEIGPRQTVLAVPNGPPSSRLSSASQLLTLTPQSSDTYTWCKVQLRSPSLHATNAGPGLQRELNAFQVRSKGSSLGSSTVPNACATLGVNPRRPSGPSQTDVFTPRGRLEHLNDIPSARRETHGKKKTPPPICPPPQTPCSRTTRCELRETPPPPYKLRPLRRYLSVRRSVEVSKCGGERGADLGAQEEEVQGRRMPEGEFMELDVGSVAPISEKNTSPPAGSGSKGMESTLMEHNGTLFVLAAGLGSTYIGGVPI